MKDWITENFYFAELTVFDTCGSITGTLKAAMKALVGADTSCLQPPYYLGKCNLFNHIFLNQTIQRYMIFHMIYYNSFFYYNNVTWNILFVAWLITKL